MVVFACSHCGYSLKKNQVDKHYQTVCRNSKSVSCMDCGKDFWGETYAQHNKCISEDQKYGGKDYIPSINKGEVKQERWIEIIQKTIATTKMTPQLRSLMEQLLGFSNIPRKERKFENFVWNSVRIRNSKLISEAWEIFSKNFSAEKDENGTTNGIRTFTNETENNAAISETKNNVANVEVITQISDPVESMKDSKQKKKKRKREVTVESTIKKQKSSKDLPPEEKLSGEEVVLEEENKEKKKFKWIDVISEILVQYPNHEISIKKLKKKVLKEYRASAKDSRTYTDEELSAKFLKKISKNPKLRLHKERVKLKE